MALPNAPVTQLVGNPALGGVNNAVPGGMGAIVAAMATQQQQQLQALSQVQSQQNSSSLFSSPGSVAQQLPANSFSTSQTSNALTNGALAGIPGNLSGREIISVIFYLTIYWL